MTNFCQCINVCVAHDRSTRALVLALASARLQEPCSRQELAFVTVVVLVLAEVSVVLLDGRRLSSYGYVSGFWCAFSALIRPVAGLLTQIELQGGSREVSQGEKVMPALLVFVEVGLAIHL